MCDCCCIPSKYFKNIPENEGTKQDLLEKNEVRNEPENINVSKKQKKYSADVNYIPTEEKIGTFKDYYKSLDRRLKFKPKNKHTKPQVNGYFGDKKYWEKNGF